MEPVQISTEFIKLDQFLKWAGITYSGVEAKEIILEGKVKVNGSQEVKRGKKLYKGDTVEVEGKLFKVE